PTTRINQISPTVGGLLSLSSRLFKAAHAGQTTIHTPAPMPAVARPPHKTRSIRFSFGMVLRLNDQAKLPGPPATTSCRAKPVWRPRSTSAAGSAMTVYAVPHCRPALSYSGLRRRGRINALQQGGSPDANRGFMGLGL